MDAVLSRARVIGKLTGKVPDKVKKQDAIRERKIKFIKKCNRVILDRIREAEEMQDWRELTRLYDTLNSNRSELRELLKRRNG